MIDTNQSPYENSDIEPSYVQNLRSQIQGQALLPGDDGYDQTRQTWMWEGAFSQHPAIIILPTNTADVVAAVKFAREQGLPVAMQSGGHGHVYPANKALFINFTRMTGMQINLDASTVRVESGLKWGR